MSRDKKESYLREQVLPLQERFSFIRRRCKRSLPLSFRFSEESTIRLFVFFTGFCCY